jgi:hypothetical protein
MVGMAKILATYNIEIIDKFITKFEELEKTKKRNMFD